MADHPFCAEASEDGRRIARCKQSLAYPRAEGPQEQQVEDLNGLAFSPRVATLREIDTYADYMLPDKR